MSVEALLAVLHEQQTKLAAAREVVRVLEHQMLQTATQLAQASAVQPGRNQGGAVVAELNSPLTSTSAQKDADRNNDVGETRRTVERMQPGFSPGSRSSGDGGAAGADETPHAVFTDDELSTPIPTGKKSNGHRKRGKKLQRHGLIETAANDTPLRIATAYGQSIPC